MAKTSTIMPVLGKVKAASGIEHIVVVADGMPSTTNLDALRKAVS